MRWSIKLLLRLALVLFCGVGIAHEFLVLFSYDPMFLHKSTVTIGFYCFIAIVGILYDRTMFFSGAIAEIKPSLFVFIVLIFIAFLALVYFVLFGEYPNYERIHRFAPFNIIVIFWLFLIIMISLFGEESFWFLNKIKSNKNKYKNKS